MRTPEDLPPILRGAAFGIDQAKRAGVDRGRLRRRDLHSPFYGVRAPVIQAAVRIPAAETDAQKWARIAGLARVHILNYSPRMPPGQCFSHVSAAVLHGLPIPARLLTQRTIDVSTTDRSLRRSGRDVTGHVVTSGSPPTRVYGVAVASVVDVWCQLSTVLTLDELVIVGDALVRRQNPPATMHQLKTAVEGHTGQRGVRILREACALVRPRTDSPRETILRLIIVRAGLPEPEINARLVDRYGDFLAWGDTVYLRYKILIEYDGGDHREDERQFHRDIDRLDKLMEENWRVIRINKSHLGVRQGEIVARIRRALLERGWH